MQAESTSETDRVLLIMAASKIEWTQESWNFLTGCDKISPGCQNCYAERFAKRLRGMGNHKYINGFKLTIHEELLQLPHKWKKPRLVFVNSMSDLFHKEVPFSIIQEAFQVMGKNHRHQFQILTKRSDRLVEVSHDLNWHSNIWMGVTVENADYMFRVEDLRKTGAKIKFISFEPLLAALPKLDLSEIHWAVVGGESGPRTRPMKEEWVKNIRNHCVSARVPFFFKQWGGFNKKKAGRLLEGRHWDQMPKFGPNTKEPQGSLGFFLKDLKKSC